MASLLTRSRPERLPITTPHGSIQTFSFYVVKFSALLQWKVDLPQIPSITARFDYFEWSPIYERLANKKESKYRGKMKAVIRMLTFSSTWLCLFASCAYFRQVTRSRHLFQQRPQSRRIQVKCPGHITASAVKYNNLSSVLVTYFPELLLLSIFAKFWITRGALHK